MIGLLSQVRAKSNILLTFQQKLWRVFFVFALGSIMGFVAKYTDSVSVVGDIGTYLGFWIVITTILVAWSRSPQAAAVHAFIFLMAMLSAYYLYSMVLFGFFPKSYFTAWGAIALLSPIGAYVVWYARGNGWIAAFCTALPIAMLLAEGYSFVYTLSLPRGFALLSAALLAGILPRNMKQRLRTLPFVAALFFITWHCSLLSYLPW